MNDVQRVIKNWIQEQSPWVQIAISKIYSQEQINDELIDQLIGLVKEEKEVSTASFDASNIFTKISQNTSDIRILSIGNIEGIDNLAPRTPLPFHPNLSVIYGHNGSGKSGYTRILKNMCGKIGAPTLISNVFKSLPSQKQCTITAEIDGLKHEFIWKTDDGPIQNLLSVDIFDSQTGILYLDKEQEVSYIPSEVSLFEKLVDIFQRVQQKLKLEHDTIKTSLPKRPVEFNNSQYIIKMFEGLTHDTDISIIEKYFQITDDDLQQMSLLEERLSASPLELINKKRKLITQMEFLIKQITSATKLTSSDCEQEFKKLEECALQKRAIAEQAAAAIREETNFDGFGSDTWKAMWQAAQKYSEKSAYPDDTFPVVKEGAKCILCEQDISETAKQRLIKFEGYVTGTLEASATAAETILKNTIDAFPTKPTIRELTTSIQAAHLDEDIWLPIFSEIWDKIEQVFINKRNKDRDAYIHYNLTPHIFKDIEDSIVQLHLEIEQHTKDTNSFDKQKISTEINNIKAKKWASSYIEVIKNEVLNLQKKQKIHEWLKLVNPRPISLQAGKISELVVTEAFISRFKVELKNLGAHNIKVELIKTRIEHGRTKHKIQLQGLHTQHDRSRLINILSEGEQRIVALAAFLADVTNKPSSSPFIFDDPISSLDQIYEELTVQRLIELSKTRQVIVFTHRLSLLGLLLDKGKANCRHIRRESWGCGEHSNLPLYSQKPIKAIKELQNDRLSAAKKVFEQQGYDSYYPLAKAICSDFRILLERLIENDLLSDVVARHRRAINTMGKLHKISFVTTQDCNMFEELMSDFSCFEHSQSNEFPVEIPEPDILYNALNRIIEWHAEFLSRYKK